MVSFSHTGPAFAQEERLLIRFEPGIVSFPLHDGGQGSAFTAPIESAAFTIDGVQDTLVALGAIDFTTLAPGWRHLSGPVVNRRGEIVELVDFTDLYLASFATENPEGLVAALADLPGIVYAYIPGPYYFGDFPDDPLYPQQWNLNNTGQTYEGVPCEPDLDINAPEAWGIEQGAGTKIGFLDMGIDPLRVDLISWIDTNLSKGFGEHTSWEETHDWPGDHGTPVAGVALAAGDNGRGIASPANTSAQWTYPIVALKIELDGSGQPDLAAAVDAFDYIASPGVYPQILISSNSWYSPRCFQTDQPLEYDPALRDAVRNCFFLDISTFACAGNGQPACLYDSHPVCGPAYCWQFPAAFDDYCFGVRGITCDGSDPGVQSSGFWVDATAPSKVLTTRSYPIDIYRDFGGCSAATPAAAGIAALLLKRNQDLSNEDIYNILGLTARPLGDPNVYGAGLLRADSALLLLTPPYRTFHATGGPFTSSQVDQRQQWFKNLPGVNTQQETWEEFFVNVYRLRAPVSFPGNGPIFDPIIGVWGRGAGSTGARNDDSLDVRFWAPEISVDQGSITPQGCVLETFTYEIYEAGQGGFLCWHPVALDGRPHCPTPFPTPPTFHYTYIADTTSVVPLRGPASTLAPVTAGSADPGTLIRFRLDTPDLATVRIFSAEGRCVRTLLDGSFLASGQQAVRWDGRDARGTTVGSGIYFALIETDRDREVHKVLFLRQGGR